MKKIIFFGDSIAFGEGVSICDSWVCKTAQFLKDNFDEKIIVNNLSINGNTTRMALERMPHDIQNKEICILVVEFGMNDCNYWKTDMGVPRTSKESFEANLIEIIERAFVFNTKHIILLTNHISGREESFPNTDITYQESNEIYNKVIREVVNKYSNEKVNLIDIEKYFFNYINEEKNIQKRIERRNSLLLSDMLHLSELGHEIYYKCFIKQLELILKQKFNIVHKLEK